MVKRGCLKLAAGDQPKSALKVAKYLFFVRDFKFVPEKLTSGLQICDYNPVIGQMCVFVEYTTPHKDKLSYTQVMGGPIANEPEFEPLVRSGHSREEVLQLFSSLFPFLQPYLSPNISDRDFTQLVRTCHDAFNKCGTCEKRGTLVKCSHCLMSRYCGVPCQKLSWSDHKKVCKPLAVIRKETVHLL